MRDCLVLGGTMNGKNSARAFLARSWDSDRDSTAEKSRPEGPAKARPRTHPPHPAALRAAIPTSTVLLARTARCAGFRRRMVEEASVLAKLFSALSHRSEQQSNLLGMVGTKLVR